MKKHLIAAAVAGAFAVPAMAQVTVSGVIDFAALSNGETTTQTGTAAGVSTKTNSTGTQNTWTTGQLVISGVEDLGGGLKASFTINSGIAGGAGLGDRDTNVALSGGFGTVRFGRFVPAAAVGFHGFSGAGSTAIGAIYQITTTTAATSGLRLITNASGTAPTTTAGNMERNSNQLQYTSPTFNGFTVNVNHGTNSGDISNTAGKSQVTQQGAHLGYSAGPISFGIATNVRKVQGTVATADATAVTKGELDWIGAAYDLGMAKVSAAYVERKDAQDGVVANDVKLTSVGVSVPMGAFTFAGNVFSGKDARTSLATDDGKNSGYQLSVRYALSKRTTAYALIGEAEVKRGAGNTANTARKETGNMIGVVHSF